MFRDRTEAGLRLAKKLAKYKNQNPVIYALPRGGVVLGVEIAKTLGAPLDLIISRKIGHQFSPEYAIGAVAEDGHTIFNEAEKEQADPKWLEEKIKAEQLEAKRRREKYLRGKAPIDAKGRTAILVDDGIATGLSIFLAIEELRHQKPEKIIVAVPVVPLDTAEKIKKKVDELVALEIPENFLGAVGSYYENFPQVEDSEVIKIFQPKTDPPLAEKT